jgi:hypothetical protein
MAVTDPNEDYTGVCIKDTYQSVIHIGGSGSYSGSLFDGLGSLVEIPWANISSSVIDNFTGSISVVVTHPTNRELLYAGYLGS